MPQEPRSIIWRTSSQLAQAVRAARERAGLTQEQLARRARVGLKFLYQIESGKDTLRSDKVLDVLDALSIRLVVTPATAVPQAREERAAYRVRQSPRGKSASARPDYVGMACTSAGVSLRTPLAPDELIRALLRGEPVPGKEAHLTMLLEEAPAEVLHGLAEQVGIWAEPGRIERNLRRLARALGVRRAGIA
jgi:y4mF family transcriptional regulator